MSIRGNTQIMPGTITSGQIAAGAGITDGQLANGANYLKRDGSVAMTATFDAGSNRIVNLSDPTSATDGANKRYVDSTIQGLQPKPTARLATTAALPANTYNNGTSGLGATLTATANGALSVDGVAVAAGDIILVKNEAAQANNGLYTVTATGGAGAAYVLTRHIDMDAATEFSGAFIPVGNAGTTNGNSLWLANPSGTVTVGTTAIPFTQLNAATTLSPGNGISVVGSTISVNNGNGLAFSSGALVVQAANASITVGAGGIQVQSGTGGQVYIANASGVCTPTTLSGDVASVSNTGAVTLATTVRRAASFITRETPAGAINGSNTTFTLASTPIAGTETVFLNGILQDAGAGNDYTIAAATLTFTSAPNAGDKLLVNYQI